MVDGLKAQASIQSFHGRLVVVLFPVSEVVCLGINVKVLWFSVRVFADSLAVCPSQLSSFHMVRLQLRFKVYDAFGGY